MSPAAEFERAVDAAARLSAGAPGVPGWLHDAVDAALPEHLGYGLVEGVLCQRGPSSTGGYRVARRTEEPLVLIGFDAWYAPSDAARPWSARDERAWGLDAPFPLRDGFVGTSRKFYPLDSPRFLGPLLRARTRRLMLEGRRP